MIKMAKGLSISSIGSSSEKYLWILSRISKMNTELYS